jgi:3-phosphoshikimate 1-carboxyvinyltransferase
LSNSILIRRNSVVHGSAEELPSSKSLSNRALVINALSGNQSVVRNLSVARDTQLMQKLIILSDKTIDAMDAGTTMRFLTAYFAATGKNKILTGTDRMKQRPIKLLVDALRELGAAVDYLEKDGFPPIEIQGFEKQQVSSVTLPGDVSSQYISALMMIAPVLPNGLSIQLKGKVGSRPYIEMTASLMNEFGVTPKFENNIITIPHAAYSSTAYTVESDWSAASYWFAVVALAEKGSVTLPVISEKSLQGDRVAVELMEKLGVKTTFVEHSAVITKQNCQDAIEWNFTDCPDLAQTALPVCAAKGIHGTFTGMESLRIKETDRIAALQTELAKIGARLIEEPGVWKLIPAAKLKTTDKISIATYHDHRMAMGFASLAALFDVAIESPEVVNKSYPGFWIDMKSVGFEISSL